MVRIVATVLAAGALGVVLGTLVGGAHADPPAFTIVPDPAFNGGNRPRYLSAKLLRARSQASLTSSL